MTTRIETEDVVERLPCPFCKSRNVRTGDFAWGDGDVSKATCLKCHAEGPNSKGHEAAARAWNKAPRSATPIERLREENARRAERIVEKLRLYSTGNNNTDYGRGWNCGLEEAEAIVRAALTPSADDDK
jgi:hypothetical protein